MFRATRSRVSGRIRFDADARCFTADVVSFPRLAMVPYAPYRDVHDEL
jgi:hypothetical protein